MATQLSVKTRNGMKQVSLSRLQDRIVRPGFDAHLKPLIMYRGRVTLGDAHRMWNLVISGMEHEATISDLTQRVQKNPGYAQLCCPNAVKQKMAICSFLSRLEDNPKVMAEMPGLAEYVDWLGGWRFDLTPVSEITHRSRNVGAGGWRTFSDSRFRDPPAGFAAFAKRMTSTELTKHYNVCFSTVAAWRGKLGISPVRRAPEPPQSLFYPFLIHDAGKPEHILLRKVNAAVSRSLPPHMRADACQDLIVGILSGDFSADDLTLPAIEMQKRVLRFCQNKFAEVSLHDFVPGTEMPLIDTFSEEDSIWNRI